MSKYRKQPDAPRQPDSPDSRSPVAEAAEWSTRIMTVSLEMVLPGMAGYWLDEKLGTKVLFMLVGFALGGYAAVMHLIHLTRKTDQTSSKESPEEENERNQ
jgi:F0F1-type ATP synthase assembly protein I